MPDQSDPDPIARRDFLGLAGLWSAGLAIVGSIVGMARLVKPRVLPEVSARFRVGKPNEYALGIVKVFPERSVRVARTEEGFRAISLVCTHLGCIVNEVENGFACPCHGSKFNAEGKVTGGPAPRGLVWLAMSQAPDGSLIVDKGREVLPDDVYQA